MSAVLELPWTPIAEHVPVMLALLFVWLAV